MASDPATAKTGPWGLFQGGNLSVPGATSYTTSTLARPSWSTAAAPTWSSSLNSRANAVPTPQGYSGASTGNISPGNPFTTISNVKNPTIAGLIDQSIKDFGNSRTNYGNQLSAYENATKESQARTGQALAQESGAINSVFNGDVQNRLDAILNRRSQATKAIEDRLTQGALGQDARRGLLSGAGGSSYRQQLLNDTLANLWNQTALDRAQQEQANLQWLTGTQSGLLGKRQLLEDANVQSGLNPLMARMQIDNNVLNHLAGINSLDKANTFYGLFGYNSPQTTGIMPQASYVPTYQSNPGMENLLMALLSRPSYSNVNGNGYGAPSIPLPQVRTSGIPTMNVAPYVAPPVNPAAANMALLGLDPLSQVLGEKYGAFQYSPALGSVTTSTPIIPLRW